MKTEYLYANEKEGEKYIVFKVENRGDHFLSERKARTIAKERGLTLAGGSFNSNYLPYDFKEGYLVIDVPYSTKAQRSTAKDRFIFDLIDYETVGLDEQKEKKFLRKAKKIGLPSAQGHYSKACQNI